MLRFAHVNGQCVPVAQATVHIEDRGHQISDWVYEVITLAGDHGLEFVDCTFSIREAKRPRNVFITSNASNVLPVNAIESAALGAGRPGPVNRVLRDKYMACKAG